MNTSAAVPPDSPIELPVAAPAALPTRPFYWSVRRELWENRSVTIAPLVVTGVVLFASIIGMIGLPQRIRALPDHEPEFRHVAIVMPFSLAPAPILLAIFVVGAFYSLDALNGERRDRSILFWRSLPVSDLTTVLAKASIPLVVLPGIGLVLGLVAQYVVLLLSTVVLVASGVGPAALWSEIRFLQDLVVTLYGVAVHVLWFAPIYGWLLFISAWARRMPVLWAALPPFAIMVVESLAFRTSYSGDFLKDRALGAMTRAFASLRGTDLVFDQVSQLAPASFLSTPDLWFGLALTAAFLVAAVRLRREREPI